MKPIIRTLVLLTAAVGAFAGSRFSPDLPQSNPNAVVDAIVQFKTPPTKDDLKQFGSFGQVKRQFTAVNAIHVALPVSVIQRLAATLSNVAYITPNRTSKGAVDISTASVNASLAW